MFQFFTKIATAAASTLEADMGEFMVKLWAMCTSTLGRKFRALADGIVVSDTDRANILLANDRDMAAQHTSRNAMIFRAGSALTYTAAIQYAEKIPGKVQRALEAFGATVEGSAVKLAGHMGLPSPDLYAALCTLDALGIHATRQEVCFDVDTLGYAGIRNLHLYTEEYRNELAAMGVQSSTAEHAIALYHAKDRDALRGPCPTQYVLGWNGRSAGDLHALIRLGVAFTGRAAFCAPGAFNPGSCSPGVGEMLREIRITAGTMAQGSARGDRTIAHPAYQRATDRVSAYNYHKRTL